MSAMSSRTVRTLGRDGQEVKFLASFARTWPTFFFCALVCIVRDCFVFVAGMIAGMRTAAIIAEAAGASGQLGWPDQGISALPKGATISAIG
jgi:hypothetical protein